MNFENATKNISVPLYKEECERYIKIKSQRKLTAKQVFLIGLELIESQVVDAADPLS